MFAFVVIAFIAWLAHKALRIEGLRKTGRWLLIMIGVQLSTGLATITVVSNLGTRPIALPAGNPLVHSERPWPDAALSELSPNTTIWMTDADGRPINQA